MTADILELLVEPDIVETIFSYLSVPCICRVESSCTQFREMVVITSIYKKRFQKINNTVSNHNDDLTNIENSNHFKKMLAEHFLR